MEREQLTQVVLAAQKGDNNAFGELFNAFQNTVYNIALRETKDPETAADVTQETFIEVIQTIGKLQEPAAFITWLKTIVYHQCTRYYRKKENKHESLVEEREDAPALFDTLEEENEEFIPDKAMENEDFRKTIRAFIDKLPDVQRSAIMMKYFDDLSVKEIAAVQGVTENTVLSRLYYGRNAIKAEVEAYEKKHDTKLHAIPFLPLLRIVFAEVPKQMSKTAIVAAAKAIGAATGVHIVATVGGTAAVAGTAAAVGGAAAVAGTASAVGGTAAAAVGIPLSVKIGAGIAAAVIAIGAPITIHKAVKNDIPASETTATTITTRVEAPDEDIVAGIPADAVIYDGHAYKLYEENKPWDEAAEYCDAMGGHLMTITDEGEQAFLDSCLETSGKPGYWIGGVHDEEGWTWVTGEEMTYTNWDEGVPGDEACLYVLGQPRARSRADGVGNWDDAPADVAIQADFGYICEWDYVPTEDVTTPTEGDTTVPTESDTTAPTEGETTAPTEGDTTAPTEGDTTAPIEGDTTAPTEGETTVPTEGSVSSTQGVSGTLSTGVASTQTTAPTAGQSNRPTFRPVTRPSIRTTATTTATSATAKPTTTAKVTTTRKPTSATKTTTTTTTTVPGKPIIVVSDAEALPGDTVQITVRMKNNPGIISAKVLVGYDANVLTLVGHADGDFTADGYVYSDGNQNPFVINWCFATAADNTAELLATLTFRVADDAASGDYPLTLTYDNESDFFNYNLDTVCFAADEGVVRVASTTTKPTTTTQKPTTTTTTQSILYTKRIDDYVFEEMGTTHLDGEIQFQEDGSVVLLFPRKDGRGAGRVTCSFNSEQYTENQDLSLKSVYNGDAHDYEWYFASYDQALLNSIQIGEVMYEDGWNDGGFSWCGCETDVYCAACDNCENCCTCDNPELRCNDCSSILCPDCGKCIECATGSGCREPYYDTEP